MMTRTKLRQRLAELERAVARKESAPRVWIYMPDNGRGGTVGTHRSGDVMFVVYPPGQSIPGGAR